MNPELLRRWFALATAAPGRGSPVSWSASDLRILKDAEEQLLGALSGQDVRRAPPGRSTESRAGQRLSAYLSALAAGVAETRRQAGSPDAASPMDLAAGLLAGAAALGDPGGGVGAAGAHRAGLVAVEAVVAGADLGQVAKAALTALGTVPAPANASPAVVDSQDLRLTAVLTRLLEALVDATRPARTGPDRADCGATADQNAGAPFVAEVQFVVFGGPAALASVLAEAEGAGSRVTVWSEGDRHVLHAHTAEPGRLISGVIAVATPFDLDIRMARRRDDGWRG